MVNFAREKRRQPKPSPLGGAQAGISSSNTISGVQELLNAAMPTTEGAGMADWSFGGDASGLDSPSRHDVLDPPTQVAEAHTTRAVHSLQRRKSGPQPSAARLLRSTVSRASSLPEAEPPHWPVVSEAHVQGLVNHCKTGSLPCSSPVFRQPNVQVHLGHSVVFRASHPQYMLSLLVNRPSAEKYPFFVDIDSVEDHDLDYRAKDAVQGDFYRLAEDSPMLAQALLMVSASHLAIMEPEDAATRTRQAIDHKSKALQLLNEAIKGLPGDNYLETLATIAVLASHEVSLIAHHPWLQETGADFVLVDGQSLQ